MNLIPQTHAILASSWPGGAHAGGWLWLVIPLLVIAVVGPTVWLMTRRRPIEASDPSGLNRARELLAERYARGEVSTEEYRERLGNLR